MPTGIQALLWDNDGVLVDTEGLYFQANREIFAQAGLEFSREVYIRHSLMLVRVMPFGAKAPEG